MSATAIFVATWSTLNGIPDRSRSIEWMCQCGVAAQSLLAAGVIDPVRDPGLLRVQEREHGFEVAHLIGASGSRNSRDMGRVCGTNR